MTAFYNLTPNPGFHPNKSAAPKDRAIYYSNFHYATTLPNPIPIRSKYSVFIPTSELTTQNSKLNTLLVIPSAA